MWLQAQVCTALFETLCLALLSTCSEVELLYLMLVLLTFVRSHHTDFHMAAPVSIPTTRMQVPVTLFLHSITFWVVWLAVLGWNPSLPCAVSVLWHWATPQPECLLVFYRSHLNECETTSYSIFDLHFLNLVMVNIFSCTYHFYEMSTQVLCPCLSQVVLIPTFYMTIF